MSIGNDEIYDAKTFCYMTTRVGRKSKVSCNQIARGGKIFLHLSEKSRVLGREKSKEGAEVNLKGGLNSKCNGLHSYSIHPESTISIE